MIQNILTFLNVWFKIFMGSTDHDTVIQVESNEALNAPTLSQKTPIATSSPQVNEGLKTPILAPTGTKTVTLTEIATSMRNFEGRKVNDQGQPDPNWKNNNPLNCKFYYGGYLPKYGKVMCSPGDFAIFETYALGWMYGMNELKGKIQHHLSWTLFDLISDHAPSSENDPLHYTEIVSKDVGVDIHFPVSKIVLS